MNGDIIGDRIAAPYIRRDHDAIAALLPIEIDKVTVCHGGRAFSVYFWIEDEIVVSSHGSRTVVAGVEKALYRYRGETA